MRHQCAAVFFALMLSGPALVNAEVLSLGSANVSVGTLFDLPVTLAGASDLYAFQFDVSYNPSILQLNSIDEGSFLPSVGPTLFFPGAIDNTLGTAILTADTLLGAIPGAAGDGVLATLHFQAVATGLSALTLSNVVLLESDLSDISFTMLPGQVSVVSAVPEPDTIWLIASAMSLCLLMKRRFVQ